MFFLSAVFVAALVTRTPTVLAFPQGKKASSADAADETFDRQIGGRIENLACATPIDGIRLSFHDSGEPDDYEGSLGDRVELACVIFGVPQATISWTFNGRPVEDTVVVGADRELRLNAGAPIIGASTTKSVLAIDNLNQSTAGSYGCRADNGCAKPIVAFAVVAIKVQENAEVSQVSKPKSESLPPMITMWTELRLEGPEVAVQLLCRVSARTPAEISWFLMPREESKNGTPIKDDEKYMLLKNGDLIVFGIRAEEADDSGGSVYKCVAKNANGASSTDVVLVRSAM